MSESLYNGVTTKVEKMNDGLLFTQQKESIFLTGEQLNILKSKLI